MPSKYQIVKRYDSGHSVWREYDKAEKYISPLRTPFYVEDISGSGNALSITKNNSNAPTLTIEYSYDAETWNELGTTSTTALTCAIPDNGRIYLRCITDVWSTTSYANIILCDKIHIIGGNIMSLLYGTSDLSKKTAFQNNTKYNLTRIFKENNKLTDASELILPATTLTQGCYNGMFYLCSSLVTPPALPSTSLAMDCYGSMFNGCSALTTAPALPATTLKQSCYGYMFSNCTSLTVVPALPATTLANGCYYGMFSNCVSITAPPTLPATTLATNCYNLMFDGCTSLAATPTLPATTLASGCYLGMFNHCTHLNSASALQATTLADNCYDSMFAGCLSLITPPALPATTLAQYCYQYMFQNCTSLTTAPILLAATLVKGCYAYMFLGCTSLNEITTYANDISASECINNWLGVVAQSGTFHNLGTATYTFNSPSGIPTGWRETPSHSPFYIENNTNEQGVITIKRQNSGAPILTINSSIDNGTWSLAGDTTDLTNGLQITLPANGRIYLKCEANTWCSADFSRNTIICNKSHNVGGNIMSLLYGNNFVGKTAFPSNANVKNIFCHLFYSNANLVNASFLELPATVLRDFCYANMFQNCTSLITPPELPSTNLSDDCYSNMFNGCSSLATAPQLPSTRLSYQCYFGMFGDCSALTTAPELPATVLDVSCYMYMFNNCTSLTEAPTLPATTLSRSCYQYMFNGCRSLTNAPKLPATTLEQNCYYGMFTGCTQLSDVTVSADDISATDCTLNWLSNVSSTGTFHKLGTAAYTPDSTSGIPHGWNVDDVMTTPLNIKNTSDETNTLSIVKSDENAPSITVEYSMDNSTWSTLGTTSTTPLEYNIPVGGRIYLRAATQRWCGYQSANANIISCNKPHSVSGNIMSLLYGPSFNGTETSLNNGYEFKMLFKNDVHLDTDGLQLPATTLSSKQNYHSMFYGCTSLTTPPSTLPATTASEACYYQMFYECTSLTRAPKISATILNESSCAYMFYGCSSLVEVPDLSITQVVLQSCMWMFQNCTSLVKAPALPATTLFLPNNAGSCYMGMFLGCTSLTTAPPVLPATNGTGQCYAYMFQNCTSLLNTPEIFLDDIIGCKYMFSGCSNVKEITVHANSITNGETSSWLSGVSSTGTFRNLGTAVYPANSASGIPSGWTEVHQ